MHVNSTNLYSLGITCQDACRMYILVGTQLGVHVNSTNPYSLGDTCQDAYRMCTLVNTELHSSFSIYFLYKHYMTTKVDRIIVNKISKERMKCFCYCQ